mmetsp:Transcript_76044/g.163228  ORF Transcript_76044/g.163228 Transcript_76044/m.163228 type:complete len:603 (-) Transcript_76044:101-1909(-)
MAAEDMEVDGQAAAAQPAKVKQEKPDDATAEDVTAVGGEASAAMAAPMKVEADGKVKEEVGVKIKAEPKVDIKSVDTVKNEGSNVKNEGAVKMEGVAVKGEKKDESVKDEKGDVKNELKREGDKTKTEYVKNEDGTYVKTEVKRERSRSKKNKKDKKNKDKVKKERRSGSPKRDGKKDKKKKRDKSPGDDGPRKRKSKWGPDTGGFSMTAIPAGRSGLMPLPSVEDTMPKLTDEEIVQRTLILENLSLSITGQELIEFFNGAVLAVTANAVQQAGNKHIAPVFACTVTEEDRGGDDKRKTAELKFRTAEGASVGMKLNGIEYKHAKVIIKRPENFARDEDGADPSAKINLQDMSMAKLVGESASKAERAGPAPKLSIFNLPDVMSEQICRDLLSQFGRLRMLSLIRDLSTNKIKGYGIFEYDDPDDVDVAIIALNGFVCGQNVIRVQKLGGAAQQAAPKPQPVAATAMANSMTQKIVSNPVLAMQVKQGREVGSRPSNIVQLLNAVYQEDLMDDQDYEDITAEVHSEASKHGAVTRVVIPKPAKDGSFVDGVGKIFVSFSDLTAARKFQMDANGRKFENRVVCASFYPIDKFNDGKYKLWST